MGTPDLLAALQAAIDRAREDRRKPTETRHSICDHRGCGRPISITITVGEQKWHDVDWQHVDDGPGHRAVPELRFAIDATCPGCDFPELGFAPARGEFVCSRCEWTGTERPVA